MRVPSRGPDRMRVMLRLGQEPCSASTGTREVGPEPTQGADRPAVRAWARSADRRACRVPTLALSSVLVRARVRREERARIGALARALVHRPARAAAGPPRAGPARSVALRAARATAGALHAARAMAEARRAAPEQARAPASVQVSARAQAVASAARAPVRGVAPRLAGVLWRAAASTGGRCTRAASPLRVRRSAGVVRWRSVRRSFRPRRGARPLRPGRRPGPRARTGANTRCRSRRRSARSPSVPTTPRFPRIAPRQAPRPRPACPPLPPRRCRGAARPRRGRHRSGKE
jgi:hypothetical protein